MHYQGNALKKRKSHFSLGVIYICIAIFAWIIDAWGHDTPKIQDGRDTHTLSQQWPDGGEDLHWHEDADGRGAGAWDLCVAAAYNPETDSYDLPGGQCVEESTPPPPPPPPQPESQPQAPEQSQEKTTRSDVEPPPKVPEVKSEPEPEPEPELNVPTGFYEFNLELNAGWNLVHIPLELLAIDSRVVANETIGELFYALGIDTMYYHDGKCWIQVDENTAVIRKIYQGFVIYAESPISRTLLGLPLQGNLLLQEGMNIVGIPRHSSSLKRVSDLLSFYPEICAILVEDEGTLQVVGRVGDPGDIPITGGQAFGIISKQTYFTTFGGEPWGEEIYE